jgi:hypothetical protein
MFTQVVKLLKKKLPNFMLEIILNIFPIMLHQAKEKLWKIYKANHKMLKEESIKKNTKNMALDLICKKIAQDLKDSGHSHNYPLEAP